MSYLFLFSCLVLKWNIMEMNGFPITAKLITSFVFLTMTPMLSLCYHSNNVTENPNI